MCSIEIHEDCTGYSYRFYNKAGQCVAALRRVISVVNPYWEGDDVSDLDISSQIELCKISDEGNCKSDKCRSAWLERLISDNHWSTWKEELDAYVAYRSSDNDCSMYGFTVFFKYNPVWVKNRLRNYKDGGSDTFL